MHALLFWVRSLVTDWIVYPPPSFFFLLEIGITMRYKETGWKWWREKNKGDLPLGCAAPGGMAEIRTPRTWDVRVGRRSHRARRGSFLLAVTLMPV